MVFLPPIADWFEFCWFLLNYLRVIMPAPVIIGRQLSAPAIMTLARCITLLFTLSIVRHCAIHHLGSLLFQHIPAEGEH